MQIHAAERAASEGLSLGASQGKRSSLHKVDRDVLLWPGAVPWSWPPASFGTCAGGAVQTATEAPERMHHGMRLTATPESATYMHDVM